MINEIKKRLNEGKVVELECIDRDGFVEVNCENEEVLEEILQLDKILIIGYQVESDEVYGGFILQNNAYDAYVDIIRFNHMKFFRIKEDWNRLLDHSAMEESTLFDTFLNVLFDAIKQGKVTACHVCNRYVRWYINPLDMEDFITCEDDNDEEIKSHINKIKSI